MKITPLDKWIKNKIGYRNNLNFKKELNNYRLSRLQENINYVKEKSRFYQEHLKDVEEINSFQDFARVPFTTDADIRKNPNHFVCVDQSNVSRIVTLSTSGTTGQSKRIFFTEDDQELTIDFFHYGMSTLVDSTDRVLVLMPGERPGGIGDLLKQALNRLGTESIIYGITDDKREVLRIIQEEGITSIVGIPKQVLSLVREEVRGIKIKSILLSTDYVSQAIVNELEEKWGCKVFEHYGMTEMGLGGGVACEAFEGYHLREADLYFEIINPITEEVLAPGEYGEVVFSTLTRKGMPLIRYRTGDVSRIINESCPCGTKLRRLDKVTHRLKWAISLADGKILTIGELDEILFSIAGIVDFDAVLSQDNAKDRLTIYLKLITETTEALFSTIAARLKSNATIKKLINQDKLILTIQTKEDNSEVSDGTAKRKIIDKR